MAYHNIVDFGAVGDAKTNDAAAIQATIDHCATAGGGTVIVPAGRAFLSGPLVLRSNMELHLERGATLQASGDLAHWPTYRQGEESLVFLSAEGAENIAIDGGGTIDGGGRLFVVGQTPYIYRMPRERPFTMVLTDCRHVTMRDVTVRDGALWTLFLAGCEDVAISGIRILNDLKLPNNDAIDIVSCRNVRISDCHIEAGDDCICLKDERGEDGCENITVTGCTLVSTSGALIIGCEVNNVVRDVVFSSCVIRASHRGLAVHLSQQGDVENILFSDMIVETRLFHEDWWGRAEPIYVVAMPWTAQHGIGHIRHVRFSNILCQGENGVFLQGWEPGLIDDVSFENVRVHVGKWTKWRGGRHDVRPCPGQGLVDHPTAGFFLKNAEHVALRHCQVAWGAEPPEYYRHALEAHDVTHLSLLDVQGEGAHPGRDEAIAAAAPSGYA